MLGLDKKAYGHPRRYGRSELLGLPQVNTLGRLGVPADFPDGVVACNGWVGWRDDGAHRLDSKEAR